MIIPRFNYYPSRQYDPHRASKRDRDLAAYRAQEVKRLRNKGHTTREIADLLGISITHVEKLLRN